MNEMFAGKQAAQICRKLEDTPSVLLPRIKRAGTINPIKGPVTYQGQCCRIISINSYLNYKHSCL